MALSGRRLSIPGERVWTRSSDRGVRESQHHRQGRIADFLEPSEPLPR